MRFVDELERRTGSRRCEPLSCNLLVDGRKRAGRVRDLSAGGLYVETEDALPSGASHSPPAAIWLIQQLGFSPPQLPTPTSCVTS